MCVFAEGMVILHVMYVLNAHTHTPTTYTMKHKPKSTA